MGCRLSNGSEVKPGKIYEIVFYGGGGWHGLLPRPSPQMRIVLILTWEAFHSVQHCNVPQCRTLFNASQYGTWLDKLSKVWFKKFLMLYMCQRVQISIILLKPCQYLAAFFILLFHIVEHTILWYFPWLLIVDMSRACAVILLSIMFAYRFTLWHATLAIAVQFATMGSLAVTLGCRHVYGSWYEAYTFHRGRCRCWHGHAPSWSNARLRHCRHGTASLHEAGGVWESARAQRRTWRHAGSLAEPWSMVAAVHSWRSLEAEARQASPPVGWLPCPVESLSENKR